MKGYKSKSANNICHYIIQLFLVYFWWFLIYLLGFPSGSAVKKLPAMQELQETQGWSLGQEDPLEEEMATHSSILVWRIPWTEEPARLQSTGSQRDTTEAAKHEHNTPSSKNQTGWAQGNLDQKELILHFLVLYVI